ncbi:MAG: hypothetical protein J7K46_12860, partial [Bacteroidales bacterium]|nr:hypothetical protein [Bacteroidales bacterium]
KLQLDAEKPRLKYFSMDSLGHSQFRINPLLNIQGSETRKYISKIKRKSISYYNGSGKMHVPVWKITCGEKKITMRTQWEEGEKSKPFQITFSQELNHSTILGTMAGDKQIKFPCVMHLPGMGTFRIYCNNADITAFYDAECWVLNNNTIRKVEKPFITISLPAADARHPDIIYSFESVAIFPETDAMKNNPVFDGFKRNFINIFQLNPRRRSLANNSASDTCAFTLFLYAEMARRTPQLVKGLTAMDLVRNTLDRYLNGMFGYGQVGCGHWHSDYNSSDSAPSLIISACYYILETKDYNWAGKNYEGIRQWAVKMIKTDKNNDGIIEYGYSGNANSWDSYKRPANWWDTIGFGHDDAYSNALAYHAATQLAKVAAVLNKKRDSTYFASFAEKLRGNYYKNFYNPASRLLAGWRSKDGKLHDYYFIFVNSVAICYGLLDEDQGKAIMNRLLKKMKKVGYTNFKLGLPGNLIPIRKDDYTDFNRRFGYNNFQVYENGGATGCFAYFTIKALYLLNMRKEADMILYPMLQSFKNGDFQGNCPGSKMTKDWKTWNGECWGYEGFLVDNYLALLAVLDIE